MSNQNGFLRFLSAILSLILSFALIVAIPLWIVNYMLSEDRIETAVTYSIDSLGDVSDFGLETKKGIKSIAYILIWSIKDCPGADFITEKQISDSLVRDFLKMITMNLLEYFDNRSELGVDAGDIYEFLERNSEKLSLLAAESGYPYEVEIKDNKEFVLRNVKELLGKKGITVEAMLEDGVLDDNIVSYLEYAHIALSEETLYFTCGVIGVLVFLILLVNIGYFGKFLSSCGKSAFVIGLVYFLAGLAVQYLRSTIYMPSERFSSTIDFLLGYIAAVIMDVSGAVLIAGLVLLILSAIARKKQDK